jgi:hypothetical protein
MRWGCRRLGPLAAEAGVLAVSAAVMLAGAREARGDEGGDGAYGRVGGDLTFVAGLGGVVAPRGPRAEGELRLRYLESAGIFAAYEDGASLGSAAEPGRVLAVGAEVRPLFLFRWLQGGETHRARTDLVVDSFGIELGAVWSQPAGQGFASVAGVQAGLGLEVPLLLRATGPWLGLHGGVRWSDHALGAGVVESADDRSAFVAITLAWHQVVVAHVVDVGDQAPR